MKNKILPTRLNLRSGLLALTIAFLFAIFLPVRALAQSSSVSGHIVDGGGAAIVNANIDIVSKTTNETTIVHTNNDGYFLFPPLTPGSYTVHVTAPGFAKVDVDNVTLEVSGSRVIDLKLVPQSVSQNVTVNASAPELVLDHPDRGNVIESQFVQGTPLNIRNPLQLVNFAQGVTALSTDSGNNDQSEAYTNTFRINGGRLASTESLLDGGVNTTMYDYNAIAAVPQVDSIQEFKVLTTAYAPEWGHTSGGIVTFATKSGTDKFHGSVYDYLRNSDLDANSFTSDLAGVAKPHFQRNQYGYAVGGPVTFPPHYHDTNHRTFFYTTWEGLRQSQASSFLYTVPTALERTGDFSQSYINGNLLVIYDPSTTQLQPAGSTKCTTTPVTASQTVYCRTAFPGNKITNLDPAGKAILNSYPLPNASLGTNSSTGANTNYFSNAPTSSTQATVNFRLDHKFNDRQSIFAHFDWFQRFNNFGNPYNNNLSPVANNQRLPGDNLMLDHTLVLSANMVFEEHFVRVHQESNRVPPSLGFNPTSLGFNGVTTGLTSVTFPYVTGDRVSGIGPTSGLEADSGTTYQYAASLSYLKGKHDFKFGADYRLEQEDYNINQLVTVTTSYSNSFTASPVSQTVGVSVGSGIADLLLGTGTVTSGVLPGYQLQHPYYAFFAQDEYHFSPRLTLTYGLRYNLELPDTEQHNQYQILNTTASSPLTGQTSLGTLTGGLLFTGTSGTGQRLGTAQTKNFDPRLGLVYRVDDKTVVRSGFGIFHAPSYLNLGSSASAGYSATTTSIDAQPNGVTPLFNMDNPFPSGLNAITGSSLGLATNVGLAITGYPQQQQISYSEQWSLDVQRELPYNFVITVGYVGNNSLHLYVPYNYNQLPDADLSQQTALTATVHNPFYGVVTNANSPLSASTVPEWKLELPHPQFTTMNAIYTGQGASSYNALQLSLERRFSQGLALLFDYTHSKLFDNVGDYFTPYNFQDNYCPACDRSISGQDLANVIRFSAQYELPFGHGRQYFTHGIASYVIGGWSVGNFYTFDTGLPVQVTDSGNNTSTYGGGSIMRPNIVPGVSTSVNRTLKNGSPYFNAAAFIKPAAYTFGDAPRYISSIRSPGTNNWDLLVAKHIPVKGPLDLTFRVELFNAFNRIQFSGPNANINASSFGTISLSQLNTPRDIQVSLRLNY